MGPNNKPIQVDLNKLESLQCHCGSPYWGKVHTIKRVPALLSPSGKPMIVFEEKGIVCCGCGEYSDMLEVTKLMEQGLKVVEKKLITETEQS